MEVTFSIERLEGGPRATVLRVRGHLDARHATQMLEACARAREAGQDLVLNLAGVSFIASSGVGALLALSEEFQQAGRTVYLVEPSQPVAAVLRLLNLDQFLRVEPDERAALDRLRAA